MDTTQTPGYTDVTSSEVEVKVDVPGSLTTKALPPASESPDQWRQFGEQISAFLSELPDYLGEFFSEYQRPLITIALLLGGFVTFKLTLAILDAINDIPLLAPIFELVGIGYTGWFVYRYLLRASNRQELSQEFKSLKGQVLGGDAPNS
jgi:hypothetical protein